MLTAKADEVDQLVGLAIGADDYITKPFSVKLLLARIAAVLRRSEDAHAADSSLTLGPIRIDLGTHQALLNDEPIHLTLTEFRLLAALVQARGRVLSRRHLMSKAMGPGVTVTERTIDVHMTAIRKKLGDHGNLITTVRGVGYRAIGQAEGTEV
jgi:two-component system phosphate regulon response regulator PhoB